MHDYLLTIVAVAVASRICWFGEFLWKSAAGRGGKSVLAALAQDMRLPKRLRGSAESQGQRNDLFNTQVVAAYTLAGLSLTAWSILAAVHPDVFALELLAVTVIASVGCPVLFRMGGGEWTRMGYESGLAIAGLTLAIAMLVLGVGYFHGGLMLWAARVIPAALILRELADVRVQMRLTRDVFRAERPADAVTTTS